MNAKGPASIARIAAENGVENFIHVSHLNASPDSKSKFYATKYEGEMAVQEAFPSATIVRPAAMFGYEDRLLNNMTSRLYTVFIFAEIKLIFNQCGLYGGD